MQDEQFHDVQGSNLIPRHVASCRPFLIGEKQHILHPP